MAKAKANSIATVASVLGAVLVVYLLYRWLSKPRAVQAATGSGLGYGTGYGAYTSTPYGAAPASGTSLLGQLLAGMLGKNSSASKGGGGSSGGGGGGIPSAALRGLSPAAQSQALAIGNFSSIANNMPLTELGGQSLASYVPTYDYAQPFATDPYQLMPLQNVPIDTTGLGGGIDTTSYDPGFIDSIAPVSTDFNFGDFGMPIN